MRVTLLRAGDRVETLFDLLGDDENDMSAAVGYVLTRSPALLRRVLLMLAPSCDGEVADTVIGLQTARPGEGITDLELLLGDALFVIVEAKSGPMLPAVAQLALYAPVAARSAAAVRVLATLTNVTPAVATASAYPTEVGGIPVRHLTWRGLRDAAVAARAEESTLAAKRLLDEFTDYLGAILGMEMQRSNLVYVVSLGADAPLGWSLGWRDIVRTRHRYFYRVQGGGWPNPPNYLGFRYDGRLQHIHHVESAEVFTNPRAHFPEAADEPWAPHYLLTLGPKIVPPHEVRNGPRIVRAARCWCEIDTLLTSPTISAALAETERRRTN